MGSTLPLQQIVLLPICHSPVASRTMQQHGLRVRVPTSSSSLSLLHGRIPSVEPTPMRIRIMHPGWTLG